MANDGGKRVSEANQLDRFVSVLRCGVLDKRTATDMCVEHHYLHRKPNITFAFGLWADDVLVGVITFGTPPSRHLQMSVCPSDPSLCIELNRLWVCDSMPTNTESWFISRALKKLPPLIVCSYADTKEGHSGYVYRATNWNYYGYTDMDRKTPRYDYVVEGKHSRDAFRGDTGYTILRRKPKFRYWTVTGNRMERRRLEKICGWGCLDWHNVTPAH